MNLISIISIAATLAFSPLAHSSQDIFDEPTPDEIAEDLNSEFHEAYGETASQIGEAPLFATVEINVSIATQTLTISYPGGQRSALISSARRGYHTKTGCFTRPLLKRMHYSRKYHGSPMPHSMFYSGGFAIHGTYEEDHLGRPASHGCIRLSRADAAFMFGIVEQYRPANTRICVH